MRLLKKAPSEVLAIFSVLMYLKYPLRAKLAAALLDELLGTAPMSLISNVPVGL